MSGRRRAMIVIPAVLVVGAIAWFGFLRRAGSETVLTASGTVEATEAVLGFQAPGRIEKINVREGDKVEEGAELASLDRLEITARREQAAAQVDVAHALLEEMERGSRSEEIAQGRAARDAAREKLEDARREFERAKKLFDGGAVTQQARDKASLAVEVAESQFRQAEEQLRLLETGPRRERIEAQRAQLAQAEAAVRVIDATITNMSIRAPFAGTITVRSREPGEIVAAGAAVVSLMNPADRWIRIFVPETRIGAVRMGQKARIRSDTYPSKGYGGEVSFIASEAQFTPKTVQTPEERVKLVYAVKVRITDDASNDLKPGMPADVTLDLEAR